MKTLSARGNTGFSAVSVNDRDEVICIGPAHGAGMYYFWDRDGGTKKLELPKRSDVVAINDTGMLLYNRQSESGRRACIWRGEKEIVLPTFRGHECDARAFNSNGYVVGHARRGSHSHAVVWVPDA